MQRRFIIDSWNGLMVADFPIKKTPPLPLSSSLDLFISSRKKLRSNESEGALFPLHTFLILMVVVVVVFFFPDCTPWSGEPSLQQCRGKGIDHNMPERVSHVSTSAVLHELGGSEESAMTHAHNPHFLPFPVLVEEPFDPSPVRPISSGGDARHVSHHVPLSLPRDSFCRTMASRLAWSVILLLAERDTFPHQWRGGIHRREAPDVPVVVLSGDAEPWTYSIL